MHRIHLLPRISLHISGLVLNKNILLFVPQATYQFGAEITAPRSAVPTQVRNVAFVLGAGLGEASGGVREALSFE